MIEEDQDAFFVAPQKKDRTIQSLNRTIEFYDAESSHEVQTILKSLKNNDPTSFIIIPSYTVDPEKLNDHIYGLLIHKKKNHYVVTKTDKLNNKACFSMIISKSEVAKLSQLLFLSKQEHHKESKICIASSINTLAQDEKKILPIEWTGYRGIANCPIVELFATFRLALFHCQMDIFKMSVIKPKLGTSKAFHERFYQTFMREKLEKNQTYKHLWTVYDTGKKEVSNKQDEKNPFNNKTYRIQNHQMFHANKCLNEIITHPNTPLLFRTSQLAYLNDHGAYSFRVFTSGLQKLERLDGQVPIILSAKKRNLLFRVFHPFSKSHCTSTQATYTLPTEKEICTANDKRKLAEIVFKISKQSPSIRPKPQRSTQKDSR